MDREKGSAEFLFQILGGPGGASLEGGSQITHRLGQDFRRVIAPLGPYVAEDRGDLAVVEYGALSGHHSVPGLAHHFDRSHQPVQDNEREAQFVSEHPLGTGQRRKGPGQSQIRWTGGKPRKWTGKLFFPSSRRLNSAKLGMASGSGSSRRPRLSSVLSARSRVDAVPS